VFGDNRNESKDGRVFGPIKESDIVGRVFVRIWPLGDIGFL
jgi:type IV secretory pathway protease TraF